MIIAPSTSDALWHDLKVKQCKRQSGEYGPLQCAEDALFWWCTHAWVCTIMRHGMDNDAEHYLLS